MGVSLLGTLWIQHRALHEVAARVEQHDESARRLAEQNDSLRDELSAADVEAGGRSPRTLRTLAYAARLEAASYALDADNVASARALLERTDPGLRGVEWSLLSARASGEVGRQVRAVRRWLRGIALIGDQTWSGGVDGTMRIHGPDLELAAERPGVHRRGITAISGGSTDGVVSGDAEGAVIVWDATSLTPVAELRDHAIEVVAATMLDGGWVASVHRDGSVRVVDKHTAEVRRSTPAAPFSVYAIDRHIDDGAFAWAAAGGNFRAWDIATGEKLRGFRFDPTRRANAVAYDREHDLAAVATSDARVGIWTSGTRQPTATWTGDAEVLCLAVCDDGRRLVAATSSGELHLIDVATGESVEPDEPGRRRPGHARGRRSTASDRDRRSPRRHPHARDATMNRLGDVLCLGVAASVLGWSYLDARSVLDELPAPVVRGNLMSSAASTPAVEEDPVVGDGTESSPARVPFARFAFDDYDPPPLRVDPTPIEPTGYPDSIAPFHAAFVAVLGYPIVTTAEDHEITGLLLARYPPGCCFGALPVLDEWIDVTLNVPARDRVLDPTTPITVIGRLELGELVVEGGTVGSLYRLRGATLPDG